MTDPRRAWFKACIAAKLGEVVERTRADGTKCKIYSGLCLHELLRSAIRQMRKRFKIGETVCMKISGHKTAGTAKRRATHTRHIKLWVGLWIGNFQGKLRGAMLLGYRLRRSELLFLTVKTIQQRHAPVSSLFTFMYFHSRRPFPLQFDLIVINGGTDEIF